VFVSSVLNLASAAEDHVDLQFLLSALCLDRKVQFICHIIIHIDSAVALVLP
jgi:hypothetical protein